jgi:AbrB family looped-hinge helix DNA binding protein
MHTAKQLLPAKDNVRNTENTSVSLRMYAGISKVTSSGQITIPAEIRRKKKIEAGCSLLLIDTGDVIIVKKVDESKDVFDSFDKRMQFSLTLPDLPELIMIHTPLSYVQ